MITFSEVTKRFGDGTVALENVSFHIEPGELVVITGPSGSGKTTLMKMMIRDYQPTEGSVLYKNEPLEKLPTGKVPFHRRKIGVVFQDYRLLPELNVWENIALPLSILGMPESEIESRVTDLLNLVSLTERALVFPKQLSGGEAQRVSIARALATGPSLVFADEPTGNLDKEASLGIVKLLSQINALGTTVLIATHDVTLLDYLESERHLQLDKGKLVKDTRPSKTPAPAAVSKKPEKPEKKKKTAKLESTAEKTVEKIAAPAVSKKVAKKTGLKKPVARKKVAPEKSTPEATAKKTPLTEEQTLAAEFQEFTKDKQKPKRSLPGLSFKLPKITLPVFGKKPSDQSGSEKKESKQEDVS